MGFARCHTNKTTFTSYNRRNKHACALHLISAQIFPYLTSVRDLGTFIKGLSRCFTRGLRENISYTTALGFVCRVQHSTTNPFGNYSMPNLGFRPIMNHEALTEYARSHLVILQLLVSLHQCYTTPEQVSAWDINTLAHAHSLDLSRLSTSKEQLAANQTLNYPSDHQGTSVAKCPLFGQATIPPTKYPWSGSMTKRSLQMPSQRFTDRITC